MSLPGSMAFHSTAGRWRPRLLLADRIKGPGDSFLAPLRPALDREYDVRFLPGFDRDALAGAIAWADIVWLEWCWDHAVWATRSGLLAGKPCVIRLHSVEALQTDFPAQVDWTCVSRLVTVGPDMLEVVQRRLGGLIETVPVSLIPNGIDLARFRPATPDPFRIAWVGHLEPKKNPMLMLQIAERLRQADPRYTMHVAGAATDMRTLRYLEHMMSEMDLVGAVRLEGVISDIAPWYRDKGILLSTSMYESFGMNIGEAMASGAFPVIHNFPGADRLWPVECVFASVEEALLLIRTARPNLYRQFVADRYDIAHQERAVLALLGALPPVAHRRPSIADRAA